MWKVHADSVAAEQKLYFTSFLLFYLLFFIVNKVMFLMK